MKEPVIIKSYQLNGLKLVMDPSVPLEDILECLAKRLKKSRNFFKDIPRGILFEGRQLSFDEQEKILDCIQENSDIDVVCILEEDEEIQQKINEKIQQMRLETEKKKEETREEKQQETIEAVEATIESMPQEDAGLFHKGNLRSGQVLESEKSIIMLGDVKPGANVISGGNIVVLGSLRGNAFAGLDGRKDAFVVALDMQPVQIRIGDCIARSPDEPEKDVNKEPKIAFLDGETIYIETISKEVVQELKI